MTVTVTVSQAQGIRPGADRGLGDGRWVPVTGHTGGENWLLVSCILAGISDQECIFVELCELSFGLPP